MLRALFIGVFASFVAIAGCAVDTATPDQQESIEETTQAAGGKRCMSSDDCAASQYCSTEDGDCFSSCKPNQPCIAVCAGVCKRDARAVCGDRVCPTGMECCNASCGACVEPGGFCTTQVCDKAETL
jgi:hypothetical protein